MGAVPPVERAVQRAARTLNSLPLSAKPPNLHPRVLIFSPPYTLSRQC